MEDDDTKGSVVEEGEARPRKRPLRGRSARSRDATQELAFTIYSSLSNTHPIPVQLAMLRTKLLAWAAIYGVRTWRGE